MLIIAVVNPGLELTHAWEIFFIRWLPVLSAIMWVGLLWYFNFVQIPSSPKIPDEQKTAITNVIAPEALFWSRYAALATVITGLLNDSGRFDIKHRPGFYQSALVSVVFTNFTQNFSSSARNLTN